MTIAQRDGLSLVGVLAWRYALGAALLVAFAGGARAAMLSRAAVRPLLVLGVMQALVAGVSLASLRYIPAATMSFLFYTYPAWLAVIAAVSGLDRLTLPRIVALVLALVGITVMVGAPGAGEVHPVGIALALSAALLYAFYIPLVHTVEQRQGTFAAATYGAAGAALTFIVAALVAPERVGALGVPTSIAGWGAVAFLAVFSTAIGFLAFLRGLAIVGPVRTGIVSTVEPFITAVLAAIILGQRLTPGTIAGGACVAAAVILLQRASRARAGDTDSETSGAT